MRRPWFASRASLLLLVSCAIVIVRAAVVAAAPAAGETVMVFPVTINMVEKGDFTVVLRGSDVLLRVRDLDGAGVRGFAGLREEFEGEEVVSLASLRPAVSFALDRTNLTLTVTVPPGYLGTATLNLRSGRPRGISYASATSGFLNYALSGSDWRTMSGFAELGVNAGGKLAYTSASRNPNGTLTRGLSYLEIDDRPDLRRVTVGDSFVAAGVLGSALQLGGISIARSFDLDPYLVRYPTLSLTGSVTTPSTADIYVNGALVRREQLAPGQFDLSNLEVPTGSGMAQVVIRDAFGQEHVLASPFYSSTAVLAKGLSDFSYNLGYQRDTLTGDNSYRSLSFIGFHRFGLSDLVTPEFRLEADSELLSGGPGIAVRLPIGEIAGSVAWSRDGGRRGTAGSVSYQYMTRRLTVGIAALARSDRYATLSLREGQDRARLDASAFAGFQLSRRCTVSLQYRHTDMRDSPSSDEFSLATTIVALRSASIFLSGTRSFTGGIHRNGAFLGLTVIAGRRTTASVSSDWSGGSATTTAEAQQALPVGEGFGYRVRAMSTAGRPLGDGAFQYQGPFGLYELDASRANGTTATSLSASGSLVAIGGRVYPTRTTGGGFALIRVPGVSGVEGLANNQAVGRTDANGDLLVPSLLPYYGNRLSIADEDVPLDYEIGATERTVAPPNRGGAIVTFPVQRFQAFRGTLLVETPAGDVTPAGGQLSLEAAGTRIASPIGVDGKFELVNAPPGAYPATIEFTEGRCTVSIAVPKSRETFVDLGLIRCTLAGKMGGE